MHYTYIIIDPRDNTPFYVGKGKGSRAESHLKKSHNKLVNRRIKEIRKNNLVPEISKLECSNEHISYDLEIGLIKTIGLDNLLNFTNGGEGNALFGEINGRYGDYRKWEDIVGVDRATAWKKEQSDRTLGEKNPMFGKVREDLRQRNIQNNCQKNPESREKNRQAHLGKRFKQKTITCSKCGFVGGVGNIKRYHNGNCHA